MKTVLLITEQYDPTADALIDELRRRQRPYLRWNLDSFPDSSELTYRISEQKFVGSISSDGHSVDADDVGSVWCRSFMPRGFPANLDEEELLFARKEAQTALSSLSGFSDWLWINHPDRERAASLKPLQLHVAGQLGMEIPRTIISNDPDDIRGFHEACGGKIIYKASSQSLKLEPGKAIFTDEVSDQEMASLDLIRHTPGIFQELIVKAFEVRATVIGSEIFCVKIGSQEQTETATDWRKAPFDLEYQPFELRDELAQKVLLFMNRFGLKYSSMDFIVTPDGRYVFLESNPGGQYRWAEAKAGLPMTEALAEALSVD